MFIDLIGEMAKKRISKRCLASHLEISPKTLFNKIHGKTQFTWAEVKKIRAHVAPDKSLEDLFKSN